ncbi:MAG: PAC2 family protein [Gemmataceae bacterium]|nr:PAC2 family protein [Gemmataceae bacterium]
MAALQIDRRPDLHDPVAVVAFAGWNDAANAATDAARFIVRRLGARRFASIDAEAFYDFRQVRPTVAVGVSGARDLSWPQNDFFYARNPAGPHDVVVGVGVEPNLAWKTFTTAHLELYRTAGAGLVVSLGALLADVPHTRETRVTGTALDPQVAARLDLTTSRYQGPTGIVGVLHDALRRDGLPAASLWANVPHYITTSQNPLATAALLTRLQEILGLPFDLRELRAAGERFISEVDTALASNPEIAGYVRKLEETVDTAEPDAPPAPGARGDDLLVDIEEYLRQQRDDG